jgi:glycine dehydrogenase
MDFSDRHIGPRQDDIDAMLDSLGVSDMGELIDKTVPRSIRNPELGLGRGLSEVEATAVLRGLADKNQVVTTLIGQGYYGTVTPAVIRRNILESPSWYTAYTPYQPEISQGRLEALLNFQTMVSDLTGMDIANSSLLDEATAAAEAMTLLHRGTRGKRGDTFLVDSDVHPQTLAVLQTRATPLGLSVVVGDPHDVTDEYFGVLVQYPGSYGAIPDLRAIVERAQVAGADVAVAADLLALTLLEAPGALGADVVIGSTQRFGVPMGFGGPHAGYMGVSDKLKRSMPGRLVGVSVDSAQRPALRLALQTREQHIRRERATSNICTAQVLLAVVASMYAVYHGPEGLRAIAAEVNHKAGRLAAAINASPHTLVNDSFFDTLTVEVTEGADVAVAAALAEGLNLRRVSDSRIGISVDETTDESTLTAVASVLGLELSDQAAAGIVEERATEFLTHPIFNTMRSETEMLRYMKTLADKDIGLDRAMIPLGSCTMKLNSTASMEPISWPEFANLHPFAPLGQAAGYLELISDLERFLCDITGYAAVSLQPNAGSQGEFAGLLAIAGYHKSRGEGHRNVCLIPASAHGTNPASAVMAGMKVVVTATTDDGEIDMDDLRAKAAEHSTNLAALMITYPSTHGVFEENVTEVCDLIHSHGGQVYLDGANLNAMVGIAKPGQFGGDVSHLNLHKTFSIPHGGGGPGIGPIGVGAHLQPFLPGHGEVDLGVAGGAVAAAPYGSAGVLPVTWMYIQMLGEEGLRRSSEVAVLNANYVAQRLAEEYPVLYTGDHGFVAHECIIDIRGITGETEVSVDDIAKRLIDFGFHAPTMSFPVPGTLMIEPTESESKGELDRFCDAMLQIKREIEVVASGAVGIEDSVLRHAPHPAEDVTAEAWDRSYQRSEAAFPAGSGTGLKYWPPVGRIDNGFGDRNLVCACPPIEDYQ